MMKLIAQEIEVIAWFTKAGEINPVRFRLKNDDKSNSVIKVDKVISYEEEKLAGNPMKVFTCQSLINNVMKVYELKFEILTCKWLLWKI
ncbi:hypothetical protein [Clostridium intestinale]|uniref:hypothetical protein n=1 Tax=Clostridium intestinale TaxID=36845 RepID=UPI002DD62929|nr:hypothetical protein [Clostridium intestinale]